MSQSTNTGRLSSGSKSQIDGVESRAAANHCPTVYVPIGEILKTPVSSLSRAVVHPAPGESHLPLIPDSHPAKIGFHPDQQSRQAFALVIQERRGTRYFLSPGGYLRNHLAGRKNVSRRSKACSPLTTLLVSLLWIAPRIPARRASSTSCRDMYMVNMRMGGW